VCSVVVEGTALTRFAPKAVPFCSRCYLYYNARCSTHLSVSPPVPLLSHGRKYAEWHGHVKRRPIDYSACTVAVSVSCAK
jgi:hypothetical protein